MLELDEAVSLIN